LVHNENDPAGYDNYAYVHGVKFTITQDSAIYFSWKLKEMFCLRKGLSPVAPRFSGYLLAKDAIEFTVNPRIDDLGSITYSWWYYMRDGITTHHPFAKAVLGAANDILNGHYLYVEDSGVNMGKAFLYAAFADALGNSQDGIWSMNAGYLSGTHGGWHHVAVTWNSASAPSFYLDGAVKSTTTVSAPSGTYVSDAGIPLAIGAIRGVDGAWSGGTYNGYFRDMRIYNKIKSASEIAAIAAHPNDYTFDTDGLVFQGFGVRSDLYDTYVIHTLERDMKLIDNVFGAAGTPFYNPDDPLDRMKGYDPSLSSLP